MNASSNVNITTIAAEAVQQVVQEAVQPVEQAEEEGEVWPCEDSPYLVVCSALEANTQIRLLTVCVFTLAVIVCVLCMLSCLLAVLVHKLSSVWVKSLIRPIAVAATTEPVTDDPRKALLQDTKSSLRDPSSSSKAEGKKKKKASFADEEDGTSCAAARDVDEEDL